MLTKEEKAELTILNLANEKGKFGIDLVGIDDQECQFALERGIDGDWFRLVDVSPVSEGRGRIFKIFKLTHLGYSHRERLKAKEAFA